MHTVMQADKIVLLMYHQRPKDHIIVYISFCTCEKLLTINCRSFGVGSDDFAKAVKLNNQSFQNHLGSSQSLIEPPV